MIVFWLVCAGMILVALLFIFPTLLEVQSKDHGAEVTAANIAVYRDQLRELEADFRNGIIGKEQYEQDRQEVERRLLTDVSTETGSNRQAQVPSSSSRGLAYAIAVALPLLSVGAYLKLGTRQAMSANPPATVTRPSGSEAEQPAAAGEAGRMSPQQIEANVAKLEKRLESNPNDGAGWAMLGRSYTTLARYKEASAAYEKAAAISTNDADLLTDYAYALSMARGQDMEGKPAELLNKALQIDPKNLKALVLAGNASFKMKKYDEAVAYWQKVLATLPPNSEVEQSLSEKIAEAKRLAKSSASK